MKAPLHALGAGGRRAREAPRSARRWAGPLVLAAVAGAIPSCGVLSESGDCAQRANCVDPNAMDGDVADGRAGDASDARADTVLGDADADAESADVVADVRCVPTGPEDCTNGVDDDCNGSVDCADPACGSAGYACVGATPIGWLGPVALYEGALATAVPDCPAGYASPVDRKGGLTGPQAACTCTCGLSGQTCQPAAGQFYSDTSCSTACAGGAVPLPSSMCVNPTPCQGVSVSFKAPAPTWSGTCAPVSTRSVAPPSFATAARVCTWASRPDSPGGCTGAAQQCVKSPTGAFGTRLCVYQLGDPAPTSCPPGAYTNYHVFYDGVSDSRGCTQCTCDPATGGSCTGSIGFYSSGACSGAASATFTFGTSTCSILNTPIYAMGDFAPTGGTCGPGMGGQPTGSADGTRAATVCCM
ncbi:MAG: hypothetical protein JOZ69_10855 [Myxococcales bacterium]|nr:hypothetical protein [Myxococcales bacterium]